MLMAHTAGYDVPTLEFTLEKLQGVWVATCCLPWS